MYIKYFKNKPINRRSWLFASRVKFKMVDGYLFLGKQKIIPENIQAVEKKSWFTKNYFIITFNNNLDTYVLSLSNDYYYQLKQVFKIETKTTSSNIAQNVFLSTLILGILYSWYYLYQYFLGT
jgi:hypothetical protein